MKAILQSMRWAERPKVTKEVILIGAILAAFVLAYFKIAPYFDPAPIVKVAPRAEDRQTGLSAVLDHLTIKGGSNAAPAGRGTGSSQSGSPSGRGNMGTDRNVPRIIERPLFDGLTVTLRAVLLNSVSSHQPDSPIEAMVLELVREDGTAELDPSTAEGSKLTGTMSVNMPAKRLGFSFLELLSREGRAYGVAGFALDSETKTTGIAANYSSGLGTRLLGVALDQGITLANQIGMAKVLQNTAGDSQVTQQVQAASLVVSQQASTSVASEATKDLRETPAELSLPAGTPITVRLKPLVQGGNRP